MTFAKKCVAPRVGAASRWVGATVFTAVLGAQDVGLTYLAGRNLFVGGSPCGPAACPNVAMATPVGGGDPLSITMHGAPGRPYALAWSPTPGCTVVPGVAGRLGLAGAMSTLAVGALVPAAASPCAALEGRATFSALLPPVLPLGSILCVQGVGFEATAPASLALTNTLVFVVR